MKQKFPTLINRSQVNQVPFGFFKMVPNGHPKFLMSNERYTVIEEIFSVEASP